MMRIVYISNCKDRPLYNFLLGAHRLAMIGLDAEAERGVESAMVGRGLILWLAEQKAPILRNDEKLTSDRFELFQRAVDVFDDWMRCSEKFSSVDRAVLIQSIRSWAWPPGTEPQQQQEALTEGCPEND